MAEPEEPKFVPDGEPLTEAELQELLTITPADVERAIALADDELKPYLEAPRNAT